MCFIRVILGSISFYLFISCNHVFYQATDKVYSNPKMVGIKYKSLELKTRDNEFLQAWELYKEDIKEKGTILHFHGNAENRTSHYLFVSWLVNYGYRVIVFDYRGYYDSSGTPSRKGLLEDGKTLVNFVCNTQKKPVFIIAQSLGGAVVVPALTKLKKHCVCSLVLESSFSSYRKIAREKLASFFLTWPFQYPLSYLVTDTFSPIDYIDKLKIPILLIHGKKDKIVSYEHSKRLYDEVKSKEKVFWTLEKGHHTSAFISSKSPYRKKLVKYFELQEKSRSCTE